MCKNILPWDLKGSIRDVVLYTDPAVENSSFPTAPKGSGNNPSPPLTWHSFFQKGNMGLIVFSQKVVWGNSRAGPVSNGEKISPPSPSSSFSSHITVLAIPVGGIKANYTLLYIFLVCAPRTHIPPQIPTKKLPHCTKKRDRLRWGKGAVGDKQLFLGSSSRDGKTISLSPSTPSKKQAIGSPPTHYYYVISKSHRKKG